MSEPTRAGRSLLHRLEVFANDLAVEERELLRQMVDASCDPLERARQHSEGEHLFSDEDSRILAALTRRTPQLPVVGNEPREVDLIIKVTRLCNLRCTYCMDWRCSSDTDMSFAVLARTIQASLADHDRVGFIWHGGEPTLRPVSFYWKAMAMQARFRRRGQRVTNLLQTNGTHLDDEWCRFFRDSRFHLGVSLDGPPDIHNRTRPLVGGQGSFAHAMRGLDLIRKYDIPCAVLIVVDEAVLALGADRIFDFCIEYDIRRFDCLSAMPEWRASDDLARPTRHYAMQKDMSAFWIRLYDRWLEHGDPDIHIRTLDAIVNRLMHRAPGYCTMAGACFGKYFTIESNGDVHHCDTFQGNPQHKFGNIMEMSFTDMRLRGNLPQAVDANAQALRAFQEHCSNFDVCAGGCPADRGAASLYDPSYAGTCCGKGALIDHIRSKMLDAGLLQERGGSALGPASVC